MLEIVDKTDYGGRPSKVVDQLAKEHSEAKVMQHVVWLNDEGLIEGDELEPTFGGPEYLKIIVTRVTALGQAFVELISKNTGLTEDPIGLEFDSSSASGCGSASEGALEVD